MDRSCSASASASDTNGGDYQPRPAPAGDVKKGWTAQPGVVLVCLKKLLREAPPDYLTLSLTPSSAPAAWAYRRRKRPDPEEVSLADVDAPLDYLSLSITPSYPPKFRGNRDARGSPNASSSVASSSAAERALVAVQAALPPAQIPAICLPPKKRKLAGCGVYQETAGTVPSSSSQYLALAIVNDHDGVYQSSCPVGAGGAGETRYPATMASNPIDAVPLQAVCVLGVSRPLALTGGDGQTTNHAARPEPAWIRQALRLPGPDELQLRFISRKRIHHSDLTGQQSRLQVSRGDIMGRLVPLLTPEESRAAGLHETWTRPKPQTSNEHDGRRQRVQGKKHGGLEVPVVINRSGDRMKAQLTRWDSTGGTVLKIGNYKSFVSESGLRTDDDIEIWAFRWDGGRLHLVIDKISSETTVAADGQQNA